MSPQVTPGYWVCPRCESRETYFAPRVVGQIGVARPFEIGNADMASGIARNVEKDVALCKACGERAKWIPEVRVYSAEEQKKMTKGWSTASIIVGVIFALFTIDMSDFGWTGTHYLLMLISSGFVLGGALGLRSTKK